MNIKLVRQKSGFTLSEMVVTVAIVSTIAVVSYPNFLHYKMETNAEMVKQHMRVIGEKMVKIYGKKQKFPEPSRWPDQLNQDEDEWVVTANLSAIDQLCWDTTYQTNEAQTSFIACSRPQMNACGQMQKQRRFCV